MKIQQYEVLTGENKGKGLIILQDDDGWYYIYKLPKDRDNIWPSIEMIEAHLNIKLSLYNEVEK